MALKCSVCDAPIDRRAWVMDKTSRPGGVVRRRIATEGLDPNSPEASSLVCDPGCMRISYMEAVGNTERATRMRQMELRRRPEKSQRIAAKEKAKENEKGKGPK